MNSLKRGSLKGISVKNWSYKTPHANNHNWLLNEGFLKDLQISDENNLIPPGIYKAFCNLEFLDLSNSSLDTGAFEPKLIEKKTNP